MFPFFFLRLCFQFSHGWLTGTRDVVLCYHFYMVLFFVLELFQPDIGFER